MVHISKQQEKERVDELGILRENFMKKTKELYFDEFIRLYKACKIEKKETVRNAAFVAFGGVAASLFFLPGFWSGVGATLAIGIGGYTHFQTNKRSTYDKVLERFHNRPEIQVALDGWRDLKRLTENHDYGRAVWAEQNGLCDEGDLVSMKTDEASETVHLCEYPWSIWIGMYEQDQANKTGIDR